MTKWVARLKNGLDLFVRNGLPCWQNLCHLMFRQISVLKELDSGKSGIDQIYGSSAGFLIAEQE